MLEFGQGSDYRGERRVRLGRIADHGPIATSGCYVGARFVPSEHPDVDVLAEGDRPVLAVWRWCAHEDKYLDRFGHLSSDEQTWTCVHKSYCWSHIGVVLRVGPTGPAGPMVVRPVVVDCDDVMWTVLPAALLKEAI